jgi:hypothetical protein
MLELFLVDLLLSATIRTAGLMFYANALAGLDEVSAKTT